MEVKCPKCAMPIPYVPELAGREAFCLGCGPHFVVPDLGDEAATSNPPFQVVVVKPDTADPRTAGNNE